MAIELIETGEGKEVVLIDNGAKYRIAKVQPTAAGTMQVTLPDGTYWFSRGEANATADVQKAVNRYHETGKVFQ